LWSLFAEIYAMQELVYKSCPIKVKPYVKAYLFNHYTNEGGVLVIPDNSDIMRVLSRLMVSKSKLRDHQIQFIRDTECIQLRLTEWFATKYGSSLTNTNMTIFQLYLEGHIKQRLFDWIDAAMAVNAALERKQAIHLAMEKLGFDEENFPYQTLKKAEYRRRMGDMA
jgi:hypothetical protein